MAEWISVENRLPEERGNYIVATTKGNVYVGTWATRWNGSMRNAVTHWMPLPEAPVKQACT